MSGISPPDSESATCCFWRKKISAPHETDSLINEHVQPGYSSTSTCSSASSDTRSSYKKPSTPRRKPTPSSTVTSKSSSIPPSQRAAANKKARDILPEDE